MSADSEPTSRSISRFAVARTLPSGGNSLVTRGLRDIAQLESPQAGPWPPATRPHRLSLRRALRSF